MDSTIARPSTPKWNVDRPFLTGRFHQVFSLIPSNSLLSPLTVDLWKYFFSLVLDEIFLCRKQSRHLELLNRRVSPWTYSGILDLSSS